MQIEYQFFENCFFKQQQSAIQPVEYHRKGIKMKNIMILTTLWAGVCLQAQTTFGNSNRLTASREIAQDGGPHKPVQNQQIFVFDAGTCAGISGTQSCKLFFDQASNTCTVTNEKSEQTACQIIGRTIYVPGWNGLQGQIYSLKRKISAILWQNETAWISSERAYQFRSGICQKNQGCTVKILDEDSALLVNENLPGTKTHAILVKGFKRVPNCNSDLLFYRAKNMSGGPNPTLELSCEMESCVVNRVRWSNNTIWE